MAALDVVWRPIHAGPLLESVAAQLELLQVAVVGVEVSMTMPSLYYYCCYRYCCRYHHRRCCCRYYHCHCCRRHCCGCYCRRRARLRLLLGEHEAKDEQPDEHTRAHLVGVGIRVRVRDRDRVGVGVGVGVRLGLGLARAHPHAHEGELRGRALWHVAAQDGAHLVRGCKGV